MAKQVTLKERDTNETMYPITLVEAVLKENGDSILSSLVPDGGHERQILAWKESGEAQWEDLANMFTGLEELLAYGVEYSEEVADPHLTRIGNMSLHKTLPIQSQLKGCIAQRDKVIYWLDENDWRFRKDATTITVDLTASTDAFTVPSVEGLGINQYLRNGKALAKITAIDAGTSTLTVEWELPEVAEGETPIDLTTITSLEIGSRLDGYDGTVRVYCPSFYIKSKIIGTKRQVWLSTVKIDNTWTYQPEILIDAYRSTVLNAVPTDMGYLSTLPVNSAISVVNTADYCRGGGNRAANDKYLTGADGTTIDIFRSDLGKPRTYQPRATFRTECKNAGNTMMSYDQYKNIFYWLYVVEYANFNCQEAFNAELTAEGFRQGGMGAGITSMTNWNEYNGYYPITPCGYGDEFGNGTKVKDLTIPAFNYLVYSAWFNNWAPNNAIVDQVNSGNNGKTISSVKGTDDYGLSHNPTNVWGTTTYVISGLTDGQKVIFKEGADYASATVVLEVTADGTYDVNWSEYNQNGKKYIGFSVIQESCNIQIYNSNRTDHEITRAQQVLKMPRWRGFDNPFGDIWTNLDGIIIDADADNHPNNMNYVYTCQDPDKFADALNESYEKVGEEIHQDGYTKLFDLGEAAHIIPKVMGANTTTYKCDYHWTGAKNTTLRTLIVGGIAAHGAPAGLGGFNSGTEVSYSGPDVGFRSVSRFVSFSQE